MGFSAYILETLKRYGRADLGPLGCFSLDYLPAKWSISKENFEPPICKLSWLPVDPIAPQAESTIPQVIAELHDIPYIQAKDFFYKTIRHVQDNLDHQIIDLGILGSIKKDASNQYIYFEENPDFQRVLRQDAIKLKPLPPVVEKQDSFKWWLMVASALFLTTLFFILYQLAQPLEPQAHPAQASTAPLEEIEIKQTNSAPSLDTVLQDSSSTLPPDTVTFTIITGTFCKASNIRKMKKKLSTTQYLLYEEKLANNCARLGVRVSGFEATQAALVLIRQQIEPLAWILEIKK